MARSSTKLGSTSRAAALEIALLLILMPIVMSTGRSSAQPPENPTDPILGSRSSIRPFEPPGELVLVEEGTRLYRLPDPRSGLVAITDVTVPRAVEERVESWALIRIDGQAGWVVVAGDRAGPELDAPPARAYLAAVQTPLRPNTDRLARALDLLAAEPGFKVGPFTVLTDLREPTVLAFVRAVSARLPAAYAERYGLEAWDRDRFALVIFAREQSYRAFEAADSELTGLATSGHAAGNVAVVFAEGRSTPQLGPILLHEMTHLLNRSVFRAQIPAWLEEGLAEDMAFSHIDDTGRIEPTRLGGLSQEDRVATAVGETWVRELWGAPASLKKLVAAGRAAELLPLVDLMSLSGREMVRITGRPLRYAQSAFLIRYLLDGGSERHRTAFRSFLLQTADGSSTEPAELLSDLETSWPELEKRFATWLARRAKAIEEAG